jgi:ABC-2 type transport system ATP-binding protein
MLTYNEVSMNPDSLAKLSAVSKRYGKIIALDGLDFEVRRGELLALLGPNGAGKSTAISLLLGLQRADAGSAQLFGESPENIAARRQIGVMMQEVALAPELRVRELIDLVASYYPNPLSVDEALAITQTATLAQRPYAKLSGGQKRQVQFALAICGRPSLMFLDEPTVGLDVQARAAMWTMLRRFVDDGGSIVLTTHYLEEAEALADRVVVIAKGRSIASGTVSEIRGLVVRKRIRCLSILDAALVESWPGVDSAMRDQHGLQITANDVEGVTRRLQAADPQLTDLEITRAGLADAFAELTQEAA